MHQTEQEFLEELNQITTRCTNRTARDERHRTECNGWRYWVRENIKRCDPLSTSHAALAEWIAC